MIISDIYIENTLKEESWHTFLTYAMLKKNKSAFKAILAKAAELPDFDGDVNAVEELCRSRLTIRLSDDKKIFHTLLTYAIKQGDIEAIKAIFAAIEKLNIANKLNRDAIHDIWLPPTIRCYDATKKENSCDNPYKNVLDYAQRLHGADSEIVKVVEQKIKELQDAQDQFHEQQNELNKIQQKQALRLGGTGIGIAVIAAVTMNVALAIPEVPVGMIVGLAVVTGFLILVGIGLAIYGFKEASELEKNFTEPRAGMAEVNPPQNPNSGLENNRK